MPAVVPKLHFSGQHRPKSNKDLHQSALLLHILRSQRPDEVEEAWKDLNNRSPGWRKRAKIGLDAIEELWPDEGFAAWLNGNLARKNKNPPRSAG